MSDTWGGVEPTGEKLVRKDRVLNLGCPPHTATTILSADGVIPPRGAKVTVEMPTYSITGLAWQNSGDGNQYYLNLKKKGSGYWARTIHVTEEQLGTRSYGGGSHGERIDPDYQEVYVEKDDIDFALEHPEVPIELCLEGKVIYNGHYEGSRWDRQRRKQVMRIGN